MNTAPCVAMTPSPERVLASRAARRASRGMTLIEILVVLAIIGLIVGGVSVMAFNQFDKAKLDQAGNEVRQLQTQCQMYMMQQQGKCPKTTQDLKAAGILNRAKKDPWGNDYDITCPGQHDKCDIASSGPDGAANSEDDITSWQSPDAKADDKGN